MNKIKVVAFDCDGVMFDSKNANEVYYNTLLKYFNLPKMSHAQNLFAHQHPVDEVLTYLVKDTDLIKSMKNYRLKLNYNNFIGLMKIEPTLVLTLRTLQSKFKIAVATNRSRTIDNILQYYKIDDFFDFVVCSSDVISPKPEPEMLYKIIDYFQIQSSEIIYVGDSKLDEIASISAGIPFVAYKNIALNAFAYINSLATLITITQTEVFSLK